MYNDRLVLIFIIGGFFVSPVIMEWVSEGGTAWYRPYLAWAAIIGIVVWITRSRDLDGF
ncbi:MAG: hypothetical protein JKY67_01350 [Pseudomonadales bacterium]|nr:hypothetical protein [Pseudomonadales bacterium]